MDKWLFAAGIAVLLINSFSSKIRHWGLTGPLLAALAGACLGPAGFGLLPMPGQPIVLLEHITRLTLAIGLMGIALRLPPDIWQKGALYLFVVLSAGMLAVWGLASAGMSMLTGFSAASVLLAGAILTPTDPIVATSIVSGSMAKNNIPSKVRHILSAESGANDGLVSLLVFFPLLVLQHSTEQALSHWLLHVFLKKTLGAVFLGVLAGWAAGQLFQWCDRHHYMERHSYMGFTLALSLGMLALAGLLQVNGLLAVFLAGVFWTRHTSAREQEEEEHIQESINRLFVLPAFFYFGVILPVQQWSHLYLAVPALTALLILRRLPVLAALHPFYARQFDRKEMFYLGWFGPVGISALYYTATAERHLGNDFLWPWISMVVFLSLILHAVSPLFFIRLFRHRSQ